MSAGAGGFAMTHDHSVDAMGPVNRSSSLWDVSVDRGGELHILASYPSASADGGYPSFLGASIWDRLRLDNIEGDGMSVWFVWWSVSRMHGTTSPPLTSSRDPAWEELAHSKDICSFIEHLGMLDNATKQRNRIQTCRRDAETNDEIAPMGLLYYDTLQWMWM